MRGSHPHSKTPSLPLNRETAAKMSSGNGCWHVPDLCLSIGGRVLAGLSQNGTRESADHPPVGIITGQHLNPCPSFALFTGIDMARKLNCLYKLC